MIYYRIINEKFDGFYESEASKTDIEKYRDQFFEISDYEWKMLLVKRNIKYDKVLKKLVSRVNTREEDIEEGKITLEGEKNKAIEERKRQFLAKTELLNEVMTELARPLSEADKREIRLFTQKWLDLPNNYADLSKSIEEFYPETPDRIKKYL